MQARSTYNENKPEGYRRAHRRHYFDHHSDTPLFFGLPDLTTDVQRPFVGATITGSILEDSTIQNTDMTGGSISDTALSGVSSSGGTFDGPEISGGSINGSALSGVSSTGGTFSGPAITGGSINGSALSGVSSTGGTFDNPSISGGNITNAAAISTMTLTSQLPILVNNPNYSILYSNNVAANPSASPLPIYIMNLANDYDGNSPFYDITNWQMSNQSVQYVQLEAASNIGGDVIFKLTCIVNETSGATQSLSWNAGFYAFQFDVPLSALQTTSPWVYTLLNNYLNSAGLTAYDFFYSALATSTSSCSLQTLLYDLFNELYPIALVPVGTVTMTIGLSNQTLNNENAPALDVRVLFNIPQTLNITNTNYMNPVLPQVAGLSGVVASNVATANIGNLSFDFNPSFFCSIL